MREVNFSIPNANKASVGITTALYDRRALDCTSTLPLINSLNNLAYLTTSSARIRDILTVDGGIERLVCILKEGRSKDMMEMWKWNLAFQCVVNIGVRGSEGVRRRVVEADMVPVIATILDNYFQVMEKCKERAEMENRRRCPFAPAKNVVRSSEGHGAHEHRASRSRRHVPPPITIPEPRNSDEQDEFANQTTPTGPAANLSLSSPPERTTFAQTHAQRRSRDSSTPLSPRRLASQRHIVEPPMSALMAPTDTGLAFGFRPVRDSDRLPSMIPTLHTESSSRPQSPATPGGPNAQPVDLLNGARTPRRRPTMRHQLSISGSDDDGIIDEVDPDTNIPADIEVEPVIGIQADVIMQDLTDEDNISEPRAAAVTLTMPDMSSNDDDTFNITHRSADGSAVNVGNTPTQVGQLPFPQAQLPTQMNVMNATPPILQQQLNWPGPRLPAGAERFAPSSVLAAMPRDEDVLMSLQLLAYVSKYCYLRSYFQQSHLVPRLKVGKDLNLLDLDYDHSSQKATNEAEQYHEWDNEFVKQPAEVPFNIFPLIEKFTARPSSRHTAALPADSRGDMQYWAGVVMRNLCRKDDTRGGIRQCAYWQCGKWEEYTRQFAKCRRCRRTKYCSKECQKGAWGSHRFWCVAAEDTSNASGNNNPNTNTTGTGTGNGEAGSSDRAQRRHHHHHHHHR